MLVGGSRISHHLRESNRRHHYQQRGRCHINNYCTVYQHRQPLKLGICKTKLINLTSSLMLLRPNSFTIIGDNLHRQQLQHRAMSSCSLHSKSPGETPVLSNCFSHEEERCSLPDERSCLLAGGVVALGKFDALHIGHRELAIQASKIGTPYLLSFVGMAEVLGWEPKPPIVAKCDRTRVLSSWAVYCGNVIPTEYQIEFSSVRCLSPRQFVEKLSKQLGVRGVVAGENYRFGYKAAGDASELIRLCEEYGIGAYIINSVMDKSQNLGSMTLGDAKERGQVSSTRVRHALGLGHMKYVSELLGRQHRLMLMIKDKNGFKSAKTRCKVFAPRSSLLNLPPKDGIYENCSLLIGDGNENQVACTVYIDTEGIHLEMDDTDFCSYNSPQGFRLLSIEFGD